eukprot:SAG11_NODE_2141_length_3756_cov_1.771124_2_plen_188_part_00
MLASKSFGAVAARANIIEAYAPTYYRRHLWQHRMMHALNVSLCGASDNKETLCRFSFHTAFLCDGNAQASDRSCCTFAKSEVQRRSCATFAAACIRIRSHSKQSFSKITNPFGAVTFQIDLAFKNRKFGATFAIELSWTPAPSTASFTSADEPQPELESRSVVATGALVEPVAEASVAGCSESEPEW